MIYIHEATGKMVNIYAPFGGFSRLDTAEIRAMAGVIGIEPDQKPLDFSEDFYAVQEDWEATQRPYIIYTKKSDEQITKLLQDRTNITARRYLADTDWYVSRFSETGVAIPDEIKSARQAARDSIVDEVTNEIPA